MSPSLTFTLPWPPSVNRLWRSPNRGPLAGRTLLSREGRSYRSLVSGAVLEQGRPESLPGRLSVNIIANPPDRRRRDLDNIFKAVLDGLTHAGVIADDGDIDRLEITRSAVVKGGCLIVRITSIEPGCDKLPPEWRATATWKPLPPVLFGRIATVVAK